MGSDYLYNLPTWLFKKVEVYELYLLSATLSSDSLRVCVVHISDAGATAILMVFIYRSPDTLYTLL